MKSIFFFISILLFTHLGWSQNEVLPTITSIQQGDLIFVDTRCGSMCDAIAAVTKSKNNLSLSHIGIVSISDQDTVVIEAISKGVSATPWQKFSQKHKGNMFIGRWIDGFQNDEFFTRTIAYCVDQIGKPYDDYFKLNNGQYYCSELIYDATTYANNNTPIFELQPMTFKNPKTNTFDKGWVRFFQNLKYPIPEGELGINPGGMSLSDAIYFAKFVIE